MSMFGTKKNKLLVGLRRINNKLCEYGQGSSLSGPCDCKYGADLELGSEQTGCPEIRMCRHIITAMTDEEFNNICKRGGVE